MAFEFIRISNLRNLTECDIAPHSGINLIRGENGSGKTSLLEAIYILGRGRSFRDNQLFGAVQKGKKSFTVFGKKRQREEKSAVGITYSNKGGKVSINGKKVSKLSMLAHETPIHIITPKSHEILNGGSTTRRRFLDWGVFHVEPLYQHFSTRYYRALFQRNVALKTNPKNANIWNNELVESGIQIQAYRESYFEYLQKEFFQQLAIMDVGIKVDLVLSQGWSKEKSLHTVLVDNFPGDEKRRFTRMGPHRADLVFTMGSVPLDKLGSRGQLKMAIFALFLAQANVINSLTNRKPVLLVDDLTAELDQKNIYKVLGRLTSQNRQVFITTTDNNLVIPEETGRMFHVEHGMISELSV